MLVLGGLIVATPIVALVSEAISPSTGMFRHMRLAIAIGLVAPAFNILSFAANLAYARRRQWSVRWLNGVLIVQGIAVTGTLLLLGGWWLTSQMQERVYERRAQVYPAIRTDDLAAVKSALTTCASDCEGFLDRFLLEAAAAGSHRSMAYLLSVGANPTPDLQSRAAPLLDLRTCEGAYLSSLNSLAVTVARGDADGMVLLLPKSDPSGRRQAAWIAARRDRLDLLQRLLDAGVPLTIRGETRDSNLTLLNAAASGAAVQVGTWLLKEKGFNANGDPDGPDGVRGETPLASLVRFALYSDDSPRIRPFLDLLLAYGADIDRISPDIGGTALQKAVDARAHAIIEALIAAGASEGTLTDQDRARLQELRRDPPRREDKGDANCIP